MPPTRKKTRRWSHRIFINRAGKSLSATRRRELERAKRLLQARRQRGRSRAA